MATRNNFDLLRLLFAMIVCIVHICQLSGSSQLAWIPQVLSSSVAVQAFFITSGFLIFTSFERSTALSAYFNKRIRRIYPAYFTIVMLCAIGFVTVSTKNVGDYFSFAWLHYVLANLVFLNFLQPALPGVFEAGHQIAAVNGALWTLKIEVMFYLLVPCLVYLFRKWGHLRGMILVYCLSVVYYALFIKAAQYFGSAFYEELGRQLPGQLSYFISGAFFCYYFEYFERHRGYFVLAAITILATNTIWRLPFLQPFALATLVIFCARSLYYLGNFGKYGDFSYGVYILHYPIAQLLVHWGGLKENPWMFLLTVILTSTVSAICMWHFVEKRFLLKSSHYLTATTPLDASKITPS